MPGTKQKKAEAKKSNEQLKAERHSDATDDEVLKAEETGTAAAPSKKSDRYPAPDGQLDEQREVDRTGPM